MGFFFRRSETARAGDLAKTGERRSRIGIRTIPHRRSGASAVQRVAAEAHGGVLRVKAAAQAKSSPWRTPIGGVGLPCRFVVGKRVLGKGAYGCVLAGADLVSGRPVAVKFIADGRMKPASLEREIAMLQRLSEAKHPAFIHFHAHLRPADVLAGELCAEQGSGPLPLAKAPAQCHALVMEAARGGELFEHVVAADGLAEAEAAPIFAQLIDAVHAAHALGIAHRDLKLENVLLAGREGEQDGRQIKLIDWGLAHQHAFRSDGRVEPERLRSRCGSRSYMAPEVSNRQMASVLGYDGFGADVWSLGVCLFAIHLGFFPFEQADPEVDWRARRVVDAQRRGASAMATIISFYPHKRLTLSRPLCALLDRMLVFDASRRASLAEISASEWLAPHMPVHAPPHALTTLDLTHSDRSSAGGSIGSNGSDGQRPAGLRTGGDAEDGAAPADATADAISAGGIAPARAERQDSTSTAHSIGSSVGSSVVTSNARLRMLEAALPPYTARPSEPLPPHSRYPRHDVERKEERGDERLRVLKRQPAADHGAGNADGYWPEGEAAAVRYAVAGGAKPSATEPRGAPRTVLDRLREPHAHASRAHASHGHHPELRHLSALFAQTSVAASAAVSAVGSAVGSPMRRRSSAGAAKAGSGMPLPLPPKAEHQTVVCGGVTIDRV